MGRDTVARPGRKFVSRHYSKRSEEAANGEDTNELLETVVFEEGTEAAHVTWKNGMTINLGNYESVRIDVGVTLPCYREEIPQALTTAQDIAESTIKREIRKVKGRG